MDQNLRPQATTVLLARGWLSRQQEAFRTEVLQRSLVQRFPAGTIIFRMGDPPGGIYGLVSGALAVSFARGDEEAALLQFGQVGNWMGIGCFLNGDVRHVEPRCATECVLAHLPLVAMETMAARDPQNIRAFAQIALENLETSLELVRTLRFRKAEQRVAAALLRASKSASDPVPITQADLASVANVSLRGVGVALRTLADMGLIELGYRWVRIVDVQGLRATLR